MRRWPEAFRSGVSTSISDRSWTQHQSRRIRSSPSTDARTADDAITVSTYAFAFIDAHHKFGVLTALKHFPGHGSSTGDTHEGFVDITKTWEEAEFGTFRRVISLPRIAKRGPTS